MASKLRVPSRTYSRTIFTAFSSRISCKLSPFCIKICGFSCTLNATSSTTVELEKPEVETHNSGNPMRLNLKQLGNDLVHRSLIQYIGMSFPTVFSHTRTIHNVVKQKRKLSSVKKVTEESLRLKPLGDEVTAYFAERMIFEEVLQRNTIMQLSKKVIAFPYRRNGVLVSCKYRTLFKKYWQEKDTEDILYGVDDIKEADEIIIVEGEIDKLSMEQAGFTNVVSVPNGAPKVVSTKKLPSPDKDTEYRFLWNCKEYLDKASKIVLATDGDGPGKFLADELARRLGRERCWFVTWPQKDESCCYNDANEVLTALGADALRDIVNNAALYQCKIEIKEDDANDQHLQL